MPQNIKCSTIKFYAELNYELTVGDDFTDSFVLEDDNGDPIDITTLTISFTLKESQTDTATVASATITKTAAVNGEFTVRIDSSVLDTLERNRPYYLRLEVDDGTNEITRLRGQLIITYA